MNKPWSTEVADHKFSLLIRARDPKCVRCKQRPSTDCSHFFERGNSATRYHPENCDGACRECHNFWHTADGKKEYKEFKIKQLGIRAFVALQRMAYSTMKRDDAIIRFMKSIETN